MIRSNQLLLFLAFQALSTVILSVIAFPHSVPSSLKSEDINKKGQAREEHVSSSLCRFSIYEDLKTHSRMLLVSQSQTTRLALSLSLCHVLSLSNLDVHLKSSLFGFLSNVRTIQVRRPTYLTQRGTPGKITTCCFPGLRTSHIRALG